MAFVAQRFDLLIGDFDSGRDLGAGGFDDKAIGRGDTVFVFFGTNLAEDTCSRFAIGVN